MRLIDADELYKRTAEWEEQAQDEVNKNKGCRTVEEWDKYKEWLISLNERSSFKYDIADAPTIEAEPIKHGRWINDNGLYKCSVCNEFTITGWANCVPIEQMNKTMKYCNNCGAKMNGERMDEVEE